MSKTAKSLDGDSGRGLRIEDYNRYFKSTLRIYDQKTKKKNNCASGGK